MVSAGTKIAKENLREERGPAPGTKTSTIMRQRRPRTLPPTIYWRTLSWRAPSPKRWPKLNLKESRKKRSCRRRKRWGGRKNFKPRLSRGPRSKRGSAKTASEETQERVATREISMFENSHHAIWLMEEVATTCQTPLKSALLKNTLGAVHPITFMAS